MHPCLPSGKETKLSASHRQHPAPTWQQVREGLAQDRVPRQQWLTRWDAAGCTAEEAGGASSPCTCVCVPSSAPVGATATGWCPRMCLCGARQYCNRDAQASVRGQNQHAERSGWVLSAPPATQLKGWPERWKTDKLISHEPNKINPSHSLLCTVSNSLWGEHSSSHGLRALCHPDGAGR